MWLKWDEKNMFAPATETNIAAFKRLMEAASGKELSASLLYRIESLRASIEPLADAIEKNKDHIVKLFEYEVSHGGFSSKQAQELAVALAGICVKRDKSSESDRDWFNPEAAVIANFMAKQDGGTKND